MRAEVVKMKLKNDYDLVLVSVTLKIAESIIEKGDAQRESKESRWAHGRPMARLMAQPGSLGLTTRGGLESGFERRRFRPRSLLFVRYMPKAPNRGWDGLYPARELLCHASRVAAKIRIATCHHRAIHRHGGKHAN